MKIKYFFIVLVSLLFIISVSQIFTIPPYQKDMYPIYKSGYFDEIEKGFVVIKDAFIAIKSLKDPVYGWILLKDIEKTQKMDIKVFDRFGKEVYAPGKKSDKSDVNVLKVINSMKPSIYSEIKWGNYISILPIKMEDRCTFCHKGKSGKDIIGVMMFKRDFDGYIYYSSERIIIFILISIVLAMVLFMLLRWDPEHNIKELFDKKK